MGFQKSDNNISFFLGELLVLHRCIPFFAGVGDSPYRNSPFGDNFGVLPRECAKLGSGNNRTTWPSPVSCKSGGIILIIDIHHGMTNDASA